jgi:hypothetical protein
VGRFGKALLLLILLLSALIVFLDRLQVRRGEVSIFALLWPRRAAPRPESLPSLPQVATAPKPLPAPTIAPVGPRLAIIIDDLGGRRDVFETLKAMDRPFTVAILPEHPLSAKIAGEAARAGMEVILHLPLEAYHYPEVDPGSGALTMAMTSEEITALMVKHLAGFPVTGVSTHMGSRITEDRQRMGWILAPVKERNLFFVDSLTSNQSVAWRVAQEMGIPTVRRHIFLDTEPDEATVRRQLLAAGSLAERRGSAIAVGHGRPLTLRLTQEMIPKWEARGIRLVKVSELLR